jgi:hypothetical protein
MNWSFDWNKSRPETAGDWLAFYFVVPFIQFLFFGLIVGPDTALYVSAALMVLGLAFLEVNTILERREGKHVEAINAKHRSARKVAAIVSGAVLVAYGVETIAFPEARFGLGQGLLVVVAALVLLGVINNRKRR